MASKITKSTLGEDWFETFLTFRLNPEAFLDRRKLTKDAFCLDALKDLYSDHIETQCKVHILLLLQEYSSLLITDVNVLEQCIESLTNLFKTLGRKTEKRLLKSQVLIAVVTILLTLDLDQDLSSFIQKIKIFLLEIIYSISEDPIVTSSACSCLEELEIFYPGMLHAEIENILLACDQETSAAFQSYVLLLNTCAETLLSMKKTDVAGKESKDMVLNNKSLISTIMSNILELYPLLTHTAQYRVLKNLISVVKNTSQFSPKTFKLYFNGLTLSSEVPLIHLAFDLQETFGSDLLSTQEEKQLLKQLVNLSTHPSLTSSHKLLFLDWLKSFIMHNEAFSCLSFSDLETLLPSPFDGPLTVEKKAHILALSLPPNSEERASGEFLNEIVNGLVKCSMLSGGTKAAPSLFRTLFIYFSTQTSDTISNSIYKLITGMLKTSLHLTPYALSFLDAARTKYNERKFHEKALDHMVEHILNIPLKQFHSNLEYYLAILESASQEPASICRPRAVLRLLQKMLNEGNLNLQNTWCIGNRILSLCRTLMKYHDVQIFYYDLAEVLCLIIQQFQDTDVKDRAKIYYCMLTSLSKLKVQTIFAWNPSEKEGKNTLNSFVTGGESLQFASCIQKLNNPILQMLRLDSEIHSLNTDDNFIEEPISGILELYQQHLTSQESFLQLPFILKHIGTVEENSFAELYGIVISAESEPSCKEISVIEIPILKSTPTSNQEKIVTLQLKPREPQPLTLRFKVEFTCNNGYSYTCNLQSVTLNLDDLFLPLPVSESYLQCSSSWRLFLFHALWERFTNEIKLNEEGSKCCQSVFALKIGTEEFSTFVEKKWKHFIVSKLPSPEYKIAIHLPPHNHLLLKINLVNDKPFVHILVDNISTLPWITLYFQNISEIL
ncbi:AP-5 complex subunit beta-1 isoform X2 [Parasteatoda tepidariorum]|uniref:AP-5 complex subunit beta-1 isoform X2 n=1 Tax=Parasteatoda tepidariorum TaxID=114398 RepID=UPI001C718747|nr:AP-5 complex subunit beta-1 isoform X2 [Parasteatoda tepidariorum]